jgi:hypothetical protein
VSNGTQVWYGVAQFCDAVFSIFTMQRIRRTGYGYISGAYPCIRTAYSHTAYSIILTRVLVTVLYGIICVRYDSTHFMSIQYRSTTYGTQHVLRTA